MLVNRAWEKPNAPVDRRCPGGAIVGEEEGDNDERLKGAPQGQRPGSNAGLGRCASVHGLYHGGAIGRSCDGKERIEGDEVAVGRGGANAGLGSYNLNYPSGWQVLKKREDILR
jgi:hypothetical protein